MHVARAREISQATVLSDKKTIDRQNCFILYSGAPKTSSHRFFLSQNSNAARTRLVATPGDSNTCLACSCGRRGGGFLLVGAAFQEVTEDLAGAAQCGFLLSGEFRHGTSRRRYGKQPWAYPRWRRYRFHSRHRCRLGAIHGRRREVAQPGAKVRKSYLSPLSPPWRHLRHACSGDGIFGLSRHDQ